MFVQFSSIEYDGIAAITFLSLFAPIIISKIVSLILINSQWIGEAWNSKQRAEESWEFDHPWEDDIWCLCGTMLLGWDFPPWCHQGQFPYDCVCVCVCVCMRACVRVCVLHARKRQFDLMNSDESCRLHGRLSARSSTAYYLLPIYSIKRCCMR